MWKKKAEMKGSVCCLILDQGKKNIPAQTACKIKANSPLRYYHYVNLPQAWVIANISQNTFYRPIDPTYHSFSSHKSDGATHETKHVLQQLSPKEKSTIEQLVPRRKVERGALAP